jgi:hypothetical protein
MMDEDYNMIDEYNKLRNELYNMKDKSTLRGKRPTTCWMRTTT